MKPRKCRFCHKAETILYCPEPVFSHKLFLEFFPTVELHLPWNSALCYFCSSTLSVIILKMVGSPSWSVHQVPSSCCSLGWSPKQSSESHLCTHHELSSLLYPPFSTSSSCCPGSETCYGAGNFSRGKSISHRDMLQPKHSHLGSCLRPWLVLQ